MSDPPMPLKVVTTLNLLKYESKFQYLKFKKKLFNKKSQSKTLQKATTLSLVTFALRELFYLIFKSWINKIWAALNIKNILTL